MKLTFQTRLRKPLRRTGFKPKLGLKGVKTGLRRTKLRKIGKAPISKLQRQIWQFCKEIIRIKYSNTCYTCERTGLIGSNWHTGHLFSKATLGAYMKYDLRVLRPQCYFCNVNCGGRGADFLTKMRRIEGDEYVDKIIEDKKIGVNAYDHYCKILVEYQELLTSLQR